MQHNALDGWLCDMPDSKPGSFRHQRGKVASLSRSRPADDPDLVRAKELMREARVVEHIRTLVDSAPPLGPEARARLASVLLAPAADLASAQPRRRK